MSGLLHLQGALTIRQAVALQAEIVGAFDTSDRLLLDLSDATDIDVSFLQILVAATRTAASENKTLRLTSLAPHLAEQAARCGIDPALLPLPA